MQTNIQTTLPDSQATASFDKRKVSADQCQRLIPGNEAHKQLSGNQLVTFYITTLKPATEAGIDDMMCFTLICSFVRNKCRFYIDGEFTAKFKRRQKRLYGVRAKPDSNHKIPRKRNSIQVLL
jgi:hypothetical protein